MDSEMSKEWSSQQKRTSHTSNHEASWQFPRVTGPFSHSPNVVWTLTESLLWRLPPLCLLFFQEWHRWAVLKSQATTGSIDRWMGKQTVSWHNGVLHNSKKGMSCWYTQQRGWASKFSGKNKASIMAPPIKESIRYAFHLYKIVQNAN